MQYIIDQLKALTAIPSPSGYTKAVTKYTVEEFARLGYEAKLTNKGCVLVDLGGEGNAAVLAAHIDTLGAMVTEIKANGHLRITNIGGIIPGSADSENVIVCPRFGEKPVSGTCHMINASKHVNKVLNDTIRDWNTLEIVLDEDVKCKEDVKKLGIDVGDFVCFDPRTTVTESGYIKSRFLDDKMSVALLLGYAKRLKESGKTPGRKVYLYFTVYEEIGHGGASGYPEDMKDLIAVDMGCIGEGLTCTEKQVSIAAKDSSGPFDFDLTNEFIRCARENNIDYAVDVYPHYSSDAAVALCAGYDVRHIVVGQGVYASHGYERTHIDGVMNTLKLLEAYLG
ncbi:MAG: M42 family metallopeptidase [Clostridia bacterium]|nr:M42 family metallopeptidase [Clostridia bacterium]